MLDGLEKDVDALRDLEPSICLEIGSASDYYPSHDVWGATSNVTRTASFNLVSSGSGCVSAFLSSLLGDRGRESLYLCTDINPQAASCTARTGIRNNVR